jgi:hypothetical protein
MGKDKIKNVHFLHVEDSNELLKKHWCDGPVQRRASDEDMQKSQTATEGAANVTNMLAHFVRETPNHFVLSAAAAERQMQLAPLRQQIGSHKADHQPEHDDTSTECDSENEMGEVDVRWTWLVQGLRFSSAWHCGPVVDESQGAFNPTNECLETLEKAFGPQDQLVEDERQDARSLESLERAFSCTSPQEDVAEEAIDRGMWAERSELVRENLDVLPYDLEGSESRHHVAEYPDLGLKGEGVTMMSVLPHREVFYVERKLSESFSQESWSSLSAVTASSSQSDNQASLLRKFCMCCSTADDRTGELRFQHDISRHDAL